MGFLREAVGNAQLGRAPYTTRIIVALAALFVVELRLQVQYSTASTQRVVSALFSYTPEIACPLAPLLHRGVGHVAANIVVLYVAMPAEARLNRIEYLSVVGAAGYLPVYLDGVKLAIFGSEPHVAAYGASAFAFGLVGVDGGGTTG